MSATTYFHPVVKEPTGRVQFALNRAAAIDIDRIGEVHRGQVITIGPPNKPPTPKALDFARGLVASGNFSHVAVDTPLGVPDALKPKQPGAEEALVPPDGGANPALLPPDGGTVDFGKPLSVDFDFNAEPPTATFMDKTEE